MSDLTAADIGQHFREGYAAIAPQLRGWERDKAELLVKVGAEALTLIRAKLEPLPDHDVTGRKKLRADLVKAIEAELPECDGIGVPQLNRWIRWAGLCEILGDYEGLNQAQLMVLEPYFEHSEKCETFTLKPSWAKRIVEVRAAIKTCLSTGSSAKSLEQAIDDAADVPKEMPCPSLSEKSSAGQDSKPSHTDAANDTTNSHESPDSKLESPNSSPAPQSTSKRSLPCSVNTPPGSTPSSKPSANSPKPSATSPMPHAPATCSRGSPTSKNALPPCPADLADQAFKLLQNPEILAGVFRRDWKPELLVEIAANLIRAISEDSPNLLGIAKLYHRVLPTVRAHFDEEELPDGRIRLVKRTEELQPA